MKNNNLNAKKTGCKVIILLASTTLCSTSVLGLTTEHEIVAGCRIGKINIGDSKFTVRKKNGKPTFSDKENGYFYDSFGSSKKENLVSVIYKNERVIQIQTIYPIFRTKEGVKRESLWPTVKRFYPNLKVFSTGDKEQDTEHVLNHYVDSKRGISFLLDNSGWPPVVNGKVSVFSITIFQKGSLPLVEIGGLMSKLR